MKNYTKPVKTIVFLLEVVTTIGIVLPLEARAQSAEYSPSVRAPLYPTTTDLNGVSMLDGSVSFSHTISLGTAERGVSYTLFYNSGEAATYRADAVASWGWSDNTKGYAGCFSDPGSERQILGGVWVSLGEISDVVRSGQSERVASDEPFPYNRPDSPGGGIVEYVDPYAYKYTSSEGTNVYFSGGYYTNEDYQYCGQTNRIDKIEKPNGEVINYHYDYEGYFYEGNWGEEKRIVISSNLGYQIRISGRPYGALYGRSGCIRLGPSPHEGVPSNTACIDSVVLVDTTIDNCPVDGPCVYTKQWPRLDVSYLSGTVDVIDSLGNKTIYSSTLQAVSGLTVPLINRVQSPGGRDRRIDYQKLNGSSVNSRWVRGQVSSISEGGSIWNYAYINNGPSYFTRFVGVLTSTDPTGRSIKYETLLRRGVDGIGTPRPFLSSVTDSADRKTSYEWYGYHKYRLKEIEYPSGMKVEYEYDSRHNLTGIIRRAADSGAVTQVNMGYDLVCTNVITCNKPNYRVDELGRRTDFTYDPEHGSLLTVVEPSIGAGPFANDRPQFSYDYDRTGAGIVQQIRRRTCAVSVSCVGSADESVIETLYDTRHRPVRTVERAGDWSITTPTNADPRAKVVSMEYSIFGDVSTIDGPQPGPDDKSFFYYDAMHRVVATISPDPDGSGPLLRAVERNVYNPDGQPTLVETGTAQTADASDFVLSRFKRLTYDPATGRLTKVEEVLP